MSNKKYWTSCDLDGSFDILLTDDDNPSMASHKHGPFNTLTEAKRDIADSFKHCIDELRGGIFNVRKIKKSDVTEE